MSVAVAPLHSPTKYRMIVQIMNMRIVNVNHEHANQFRRSQGFCCNQRWPSCGQKSNHFFGGIAVKADLSLKSQEREETLFGS